MGWLGYTEAELNDTDVNMIVLAYEGKVEMLKACYGSTEKRPAIQPTANDIRDFAATHNAMMGGK